MKLYTRKYKKSFSQIFSTTCFVLQATTSAAPTRESESAMSIVELPPGTLVPDGAEDEASEVSISEPPDEKSPSTRKRKSKDQNAKRKTTETPTLLDPDLAHKKRSDQVITANDTRSEHSKNKNNKGRSSPRTPSRNSPLVTERKASTPTSGIESVSSKLESDSSNSRRKIRATDGAVQQIDKKTKSPTPTRANKEGRKTPVKRKKEAMIEPDSIVVEKQLHAPADQYPQISPDLQRKPPPKPKAKKSDDTGDEVEVTLRPGSSAANRRRPTKKEREIRERNVRTPDPEREPRERNVITPDPVSRVDSGFEDNDPNAVFERPCPVLERPPTPRQPRAPSPEERPLVVPLPPPRIPNGSHVNSHPFNPTVSENTTGHQLFCADQVPPPIPERPVSMHIDTLSLPNVLSEPPTKQLSKNIEPPPVPERPQLGSMQTIDQEKTKNNTLQIAEPVEEIPLQHQKMEITNPSVSQNPTENNAYQPMEKCFSENSKEQQITDKMCSKRENVLIADVDTIASFHPEPKQALEVTNPVNSSLQVPPTNDISMHESDISKDNPIPPVASIIEGSKQNLKSRSPKLKLKIESNSKSVITPPTLVSKQSNDSISSDRNIKNNQASSFQSNETNLDSSTIKTQNASVPSDSPLTENFTSEPSHSEDIFNRVSNNVKSFDEKNHNFVGADKGESDKVTPVKPSTSAKTHTITLEMPKIEPKLLNDNNKGKVLRENLETPDKVVAIQDLAVPSPDNLSIQKVVAPITERRNEETKLSTKTPIPENKNYDSSTSTSRSVTEKDSILQTTEKQEQTTVKNNEVEAIVKPAPPATQKKQPEKKVSIKQQLQQAALQKLQQQQARHAMRQANVEKVSTTARPKTPQIFGNTPAAELYVKEASVTSKKTDVSREMVPTNSDIIMPDMITNGQKSSESRESSSGKQEDGKSLINSVPKPFKPDWIEGKSEPSSPQTSSTRNQKIGTNELRKDNTSDSVGSAISLSSSGSDHSLPKPTTLPSKLSYADEPVKRPFDNLLQSSSPGGSSSSIQKPNQRDSKVIKAAQYWNNFIGDMGTKTKPVETTKIVEKPKKITSAGVGQKGYNNLKEAFEQKNKKEPVVAPEKFGIQRRNSKKLSIDGCQPGLRVNDALSVFESKNNQPSTPVIYRRNSVKDGGQPKWSAKQKTADVGEQNNNNQPTTPITILKQDDIENIKQMNSKPNSPEIGQMENSKIDFRNNEKKSDNKNIPNGVYEEALNGIDKNSENIKLKNDINISKSDRKNKELDGSLDNKIVEKNAVQKVQLNKDPIKDIKQETSPKVIIKKDQGKIKQANIGGKPSTNPKKDSVLNSPKLEDNFDPEKNKNIETNLALSPSSATPSKAISSSKPGQSSNMAPNQAAREADLIEAKLSAKDVIAREVFKIDTAGISLEEKGFDSRQGSKLETTNPTKAIHDTKTLPTQKLNNVSTDEEEFVLRPGTMAKKVEKSKNTSDSSEGGRTSSNDASASKAVADDAPAEIQPQNPLEGIKNSLKKVARPPTMRNTTASESVEEKAPTVYNNKLEQEPKHTDKLTSSVLIGSNNKQQLNTSVPPLNKGSNVTHEILKTSSPTTPPSTRTVADTNLTTNNLKSDKDNDIISTSKSTRIIPIKIERDTKKVSETQGTISDLTSPAISAENDSVKEGKREEHYIPIMVEGKGMIHNSPITSQISREDQDEETEKFDTFHSNSLSRRRFGSRKKRMSSAYSDSSTISDEGSELGGAAFSGLQRFSSLGKHGLEENIPVLKLRKTKPPFTMQRSDSCSSGEDDFDDDGFREMTAENLFSTLLTRVKSLTRRIHDEHDEQLDSRFRQNHRILNHPLNPGGTHARLERSAQRNAIKRDKPPALSRQSSTDAASRYSTYDDGTSSMQSYGGGVGLPGDNDSGTADSTAALMRKYGSNPGGGRDDTGSVYSAQSLQRGTSNANWSDTESIYSEPSGVLKGTPYNSNVESPKRCELSSSSKLQDVELLSDAGNDISSNVSVTSRQKLRPGYLPPPFIHLPDTTSTTSKFSNAVCDAGGADVVNYSSTTTTTTSSFSVPIATHVEQVRDSNDKKHEISSKYLPNNELKKSFNTTSATSTTNNLESSSSLSHPNTDFRSTQKEDKTMNYPSNIYVKMAKPFTNPPPLPMKTEMTEEPEEPTNSKHTLDPNTTKLKVKEDNEVPKYINTTVSQPLISNPHVSTNINDTKDKSNIILDQPKESWDQNKSIFNKSVHPRKLIPTAIDTTEPSSPSRLGLNIPVAMKAKEEVLVASGVLSPQPKVNPHEATKKLEIQMKSNLPNPTIPSEGQFLTRALNLRNKNNNNSNSSSHINSSSLTPSTSLGIISTSTTSCTTSVSTSTESVRSCFSPVCDIRRNTFTAPSASRSQSISIPISNNNTIVINPTQTPTTSKPHFVPQPVVVMTNRNRNRNSLGTTSNPVSPLRTQLPQSTSQTTFSSPSTSPLVSVGSPPFLQPTRPTTPQLERRTSYFDSQTEYSPPTSSSQTQKSRRVILPYGGAKSDGLLNQHAFISVNIIAAAERRKRDPSLFNKSTTSDLPLEKVIFTLHDTMSSSRGENWIKIGLVQSEYYGKYFRVFFQGL